MVSHGSFGQTEKFDQTRETFVNDPKLPVLVNRGDLFPVEKIRQALFVLEEL
jgi:hypothetical protein